MTVREQAAQIKAGIRTSVSLCEECVRRIQKNDQTGRKLNAVSALAPDWRKQAEELDRNPEKVLSELPLYGIPVLIKDNIEVRGMANTAGSYVLQDLIAEEDCFVVKKLREAGAVILGKCNLSEFAYWMSEDGMPSGYSSLSGQVVHPYNPAYDPSGSSSGSAVAAAARYCDLTVGTETDGSLMSPAISNGIVSIKPTVGLVSRTGILPLSHVQDTAGPMANNVTDCVALLEAMAGADDADPAHTNALVQDYQSALKTDLTGKRIGVFTVKGYSHNGEYLVRLKQIIRDHGGEVFEFEYESGELDEFECLVTEFKYDINRYLKSRSCSARSLSDIIRMNEENRERCLKYGQSLLIRSERSSGSMQDAAYADQRDAINKKASGLLDGMIDDHQLSCLVTVCSSTPVNYAAITGACSMVIPARPVNETVYDPLSFYLMGKANTERELITLAYTLETALNIKSVPSWLK